MSDAVPSFKKINSQKHKKNSQFHKSCKAHSKSTLGETKSTAAIAPVSKLPSNWEKYEKAIDHQLETTSVVGIDFNSLPTLPIINSQFQLKQDKAFLPNSQSSLNAGDFFQLDMNLISLGLATIPFYQRMGIGKDKLHEDEVNVMNKSALEANILYQKYLVKNKNTVLQTTNVEVSELDDCTPDEVEIRTDNLEVAVQPGRKKDPETEELEEWLENIV